MPFFIVRAAGLPEAEQFVAHGEGFATREAAERAAGRLYPGQSSRFIEAEDQEEAIRLALDEFGAPAEPPLGEDAVHLATDDGELDARLRE